MIAIVGGGASGLLVAANLQKRSPATQFVVIEPLAVGGIAYSTAEPAHLLNVRAGSMSAWVDAPDDFARWAGVSKTAFAQRMVYGEYLRQLVAPSRILNARADSVSRDGVVTLSTGERIEARAVVLALGHVESTGPGHPAWQPLPLQALSASRIVILGAGLTCVDVVLSLEAHGFKGEVVAYSRHGWFPLAHEHEPVAPRPPRNWPPEFTSAGALVQAARAHLQSGEGSWQSAADGLRPIVSTVWAAFSQREKGRFIRHAASLWGQHRHRISPEVSDVMTRWQREGRLTIRRAHAKDVRVTSQDFIVNALGPSRRPPALVEQLIAEGSARSGPLGFGLHATSTGALIDAHENTSATLFTLGPLLKGELWETTAIPEIREQAHALAQRLGLAQSIR